MAALGSKITENSSDLAHSLAVRSRAQIRAMEMSLREIDQAIRDLSEDLRNMQGITADGAVAIQWERNRPVWVKWKYLKGRSGQGFWTYKRIKRPIPSLKVENRTDEITRVIRCIEKLRAHRTSIQVALGNLASFWSGAKQHIEKSLSEAKQIAKSADIPA